MLNSSGTTLQTSSNSGTTNEIITRTVTAGTCYARVYPKNNSNWDANNCYTLKVALGTASGQQLNIDGNEEVVSPIMVKIYPNPASNSLTIYTVGDNTIKTLSMYNNAGQLIYSQEIKELFTTLDVEKLVTGIYYIMVRDETGQLITTEKVVKE